MKSAVSVFAPGTVSNLNCGFDILGFAVEGPGDVVTVHRADRPGVFLTSVSGDGGQLPRDPKHNSATVAVARLLDEARVLDEARGLDEGQDRVGERVGVEVELEKRMPLRSGLGSSAASGVAAVVAADALLGLDLPREVLLRCAVEGERVACGSAHADNAAPSLYGGLVVVRSQEEPKVIELPVPEGLSCALVRPEIEVDTGEARALLGDQLELKSAVRQWGNIAALVAGIFRSDFDLIASALVDVVAEPARAGQVPGFFEAREAALEVGALGAGLSGSGPTIFALTANLDLARSASEAMARVLEQRSGKKADVFVSPVGVSGTRILEEAP